MNTLKEMKKFFEREYISTERYLQGRCYNDKAYVVNMTIQYLLGVAQFVQHLDISYEDSEKIYSEYKEKLENLLTD